MINENQDKKWFNSLKSLTFANCRQKPCQPDYIGELGYLILITESIFTKLDSNV